MEPGGFALIPPVCHTMCTAPLAFLNSPFFEFRCKPIIGVKAAVTPVFCGWASGTTENVFWLATSRRENGSASSDICGFNFDGNRAASGIRMDRAAVGHGRLLSWDSGDRRGFSRSSLLELYQGHAAG